MDANIKENVEKMVTAGKENGSMKTTTITQLWTTKINDKY